MPRTRTTLKLAAAIVFGLSIAPPLSAQAPPARPKEGWEEVREAITSLRDRARQLRTESLHKFQAAAEECSKEIFNSKCMERAKRERNEREREASRLDKSALAIERSVKTETREAKQAQRTVRAEMRSAAGSKKAVEAQNKLEKAELKLEKLKPGAGADANAE